MLNLDQLICRRATLDEIVDVRWVVLRPGRARETAIFAGDDAPDTIHAAAFIGARVIGCATLMLAPWQDRPAWQLRGMAVLAEYRGRGVGQLLLVELDNLARAAGNLRQMWCNAREEAMAFYRKQGWEIASERFHIADVGPHFKMTRMLP